MDTDLTEIEKEVLIKCAKLGMSTNSNKKLETIIKRFLPRKQEEAKKAIKNLRRKGFLRIYKKPDVYSLTRKGMRMAYLLLDERKQESYPSLRFKQ